jgi:hypothetical protein
MIDGWAAHVDVVQRKALICIRHSLRTGVFVASFERGEVDDAVEVHFVHVGIPVGDNGSYPDKGARNTIHPTINNKHVCFFSHVFFV